ncbi:MAG: DUF4837 family protein [Candidatus Cryptobacteroides sp.]|nr:DUF4837 family protein [Bacteroidales bacterium]MDY2707782.1 DUF4837 family protein [Candidatus Cryptobacteroides sp.]MDD6509566.1 DUF4837 family protein [Bacteroidales bacterium]MDD6809829.1 DUF4837 family protein [Bacteroidales bacterium]MDD7532772.1 DUF4837 family protein [Bacteroidales bacterium]
MKRILSSILFCFAALAALVSCGNSKNVLPGVSGKAGEVIVVIEKAHWDGELGDALREYLACDCDFLPQPEPLYNLAYVTPAGFTNMFQSHRNIIMVHIDQDVKEDGITFYNNKWARPQCIIMINAKGLDEAVAVVRRDYEKIRARLEQAERDRVVASARLYEAKEIRENVAERFGGSIVFPSGYVIKKINDSFAWIGNDNTYVYKDILVYRYPANGKDDLQPETIIAQRNRILKENVPGMFDGTYMTTSQVAEPKVSYINYKGHDFAETRGFWEVENDFMGGPFVSHSFYSLDGSEILVFEAFVYAPKYDKRQYMRQTESLLYSFQWADTMI